MPPDYGTVDVHEPETRHGFLNRRTTPPRSAQQTLREAIDRLNWEREDIEAAYADCVKEAKALKARFEETVLAASVRRKEQIQRYEAASVASANDYVLAAQLEAAKTPPHVPASLSLNHLPEGT